MNLYPFVETAAREDVTFDELIEQIDIGGPSMVRAAAKNFRDVLIVVEPEDYPAVLTALETGSATPAFRFELARKAFAHTAAYDGAIASTLGTVECVADGFERPAPSEGALPPRLVLDLPKLRDLRYGENPHQKAAWYARGREGFGAVDVLQGKELSFTNLLDLDSAARIVLEFTEPAAAVIKHTNPCGAATGRSAADAYVRAREADALAAFGGIVGLNRPIDVETAQAITSTFIEAVIAPGVDEAARALLAKKANMRVVVVNFDTLRSATTPEVRSILGAVLVQQRDVVSEATSRVAGHGRPQGGDRAGADRRRVEGAALRVARLRAREVQHGHLHQCRADAGDWRRADEPRRCSEDGRGEGARAWRGEPAEGIRGRLRRLLPVP